MKTHDLKGIVNFYTDVIGSKIWLKQEDCTILKHGNFLFGFCQRDTPLEDGWLLTFFFNTTEEVNELYELLKNYSPTKPIRSKKYAIYQFYMSSYKALCVVGMDANILVAFS